MPRSDALFFRKINRTRQTMPFAILSHQLWIDQFAGDENVAGRTIHIDETQLTVVGVAPKGFRGLTGNAELWVPITMAPAIQHRANALTWWGTHWHRVVGRLAEDVTLAGSAAELMTFGKTLDEQFASPVPGTAIPIPLPLAESRLDPNLRRSMAVLMGAVVFVLLIACINVAGLVVTRSAHRQKEIAIRIAMGASKARVARQVLMESVLLSMAGAAVGTAFAVWSLDVMTSLMPTMDTNFLFQTADVTVNRRVFAFSATTAVVAGMLAGIVPALRSPHDGLASDLRGVTKAAKTSLALRPSQLLITSQFAAAMLLLLGAGLMLRSFAQLQAVDSGFNPNAVFTAWIQPNIAEPKKRKRTGVQKKTT